MMRLVNIVLVVVTLGVALQVYGLEMQSRGADKKLLALKVAIAEEQENIRRLRAEWSHLNAPERLEKLAVKHLQHAPSKVAQVMRHHEISDRVRSLQPDQETGAADPIADMLAGNIGAIQKKDEASRKEPDLIADILKGLN